MKFEKTQVWGFERALHGMRNPLESWERSDSYYESIEDYLKHEVNDPVRRYIIGSNDMGLAKMLIKGGEEHRKFLREICVWVDITAPMYFFSEFDTYKIGTTSNSTSKMHRLASVPIAIDCFEMDDSCKIGRANDKTWELIIGICEDLRQKYIETKDKKFWKELIRILPESWVQTRTISMNYEVVYNMIQQRKDHKLNEWSGLDDSSKQNFIAWVKTLPYAKELFGI